MKVGTDGVLLGAWARVGHCQRILDMGTGTGLVALMAAQRSMADIVAIDLDADAAVHLAVQRLEIALPLVGVCFVKQRRIGSGGLVQKQLQSFSCLTDLRHTAFDFICRQ